MYTFVAYFYTIQSSNETEKAAFNSSTICSISSKYESSRAFHA